MDSETTAPQALPTSDGPPPLPVGRADVDAAGPVPVLPYLTPMTAAEQGVWRDGKVLVVAKETVLPPACVKCNAPSDGRPIRKKFWWHHPAWLLLILVPYGLLLCLIIVLVIRKSGVVHYSLCDKHRRRRWTWVGGGFALALAGVAGFIYAAVENQVGWLPVALVGFIVGLLFVILGQSVRPSRIDLHYLWLKGAGEDFLAQFPPLRQQ